MGETYMKMALALAERGRGWTSPNPMVGAVVVKDGKVVGKGFHQAAGEPHAEIYALDEAGENAKGASLYVTLEPCNHVGRTPPCTKAILKGGIKRVVAGMKDPNPRVTGGGLDFLTSQGLDVTVGVCEDECRRLNEIFIKYVTTSLPFVILKCASTLDGRIATRTGDSKWITNPESRKFVHELRHTVDAVMVGIGTVAKDNPQLTTRIEGSKGSDPVRIILDTHLSVSPEAKLLHLSSGSDTLIVTSRPVEAEKRKVLESSGVRLLAMDCYEDQIDLKTLVKELIQEEPFFVWLPTYSEYENQEEYLNHNKKGYVPWVVCPSSEGRLDEDDPLGSICAMRRPHFAESILRTFSLGTDDPFRRIWKNSSGKPMAHSDACIAVTNMKTKDRIWVSASSAQISS